MNVESRSNLYELALTLREKLELKKCLLLYAYNGTGKTRLSMEFKNLGRRDMQRDTLYFNAFTEDLFYWDNDLANDSVRVLRFNRDSVFFSSVSEFEMDTRITDVIKRYINFQFKIDYEQSYVYFWREEKYVDDDGSDAIKSIDNIKISRGEENIFIWGFFLAVLQLAIDGSEAYNWVKYIYVDDPVSSLDDNNIITLAHQLAKIIKDSSSNIGFIISSHHTLFFNVLCNEMKKMPKFFIYQNKINNSYDLRETSDTPSFHHIASLVELHRVSQSDNISSHHFNMLRNVLEKTAVFHGYENFSACIKIDNDDEEGVLHTRIVNIINHGDYSLYDPVDMLPENMGYFRSILNDFIDRYSFNKNLFTAAATSGDIK